MEKGCVSIVPYLEWIFCKYKKVDFAVFIFSMLVFVPVIFIVCETIFLSLSMLVVRVCLWLFDSGLFWMSQVIIEKIVALFNMNSHIKTSQVREAVYKTPAELADNYIKTTDNKNLDRLTEKYEKNKIVLSFISMVFS